MGIFYVPNLRSIKWQMQENYLRADGDYRRIVHTDSALKHYCASIQHALSVCDAYIMQRGGRAFNNVLKSVYRHTMSDKSDAMTDLASNHFEELYGEEKEKLCKTKCNIT